MEDSALVDLEGLKIGVGNWLERINAFGEAIRPDFWDGFVAVSEQGFQGQ